MDKQDTLYLISNLISFINSEDFDATIVSLSEACNVHIQLVRKAILKMLDNAILSSCLDAENFYNKHDPEASLIETFHDDPESFASDLLSGAHDSLIWAIDLKILAPDENQILPLTSIEYGAILSTGETDKSFKKGALFEKKDNTISVSKTVRSNQETIREAKDNKLAVTFSYKDSKGNIINPICFPIDIFTNVSDNWVYFKTTEGYLYRLDRITNLVRIVKDAGPFPEVIHTPYEKNIWGAAFDKGETPTHVKIRIRTGIRNLTQKITNDLQHRNGVGKLYENDGYLFYEDDIIGVQEFQRWLRAYGSSIQVIEPLFLRENIKAAAKTTLEYYEKSKYWKDL